MPEWSLSAISDQSAAQQNDLFDHLIGGAADRGEHREGAGAIAPNVI